MLIKGINHVSINVKDMSASAAFYGGVLGMRRLQTVPMGDPNPPGTSARGNPPGTSTRGNPPGTSTRGNPPDTSARGNPPGTSTGFSITYFEIPGGGRLELFDYGGKNRDVPREESEAGLRHLAFTIDDVAAAEQTLREKGVTIVLPTTDIPSLGARVLLFKDPNGVTLEFCQELK
jgi:catechol 2,3-dioxygenase-like lactoylglutathione lyase family enzyme